MPAAVESGFVTELLVAGTRLRLPPRHTQQLPAMGCLTFGLQVFGVLFAAAGVGVLLATEGPGALSGLPFVLIGLITAVLGRGLKQSHAEVEVDRDEVRCIERFGFLRRRRRCNRADVARVVVEELPESINERVVRGIGMILLETHTGRPLRFGVFYRIETLQPFAQRIAELLGLDQDGDAVAVERAGDPRPELRGPVPERPPAGSNVTLEPNAAGLLMTIPPVGMRGPARVLLLIGLVFTVLPLVIGGAIFLLAEPDSKLVALVPAIFAAVGIALIVASLVIARRHALVAVAQGSLLIKRVRPFLGTRTHDWPPGSVRDIVVADSTTSVNNRVLRQLRIDTSAGPVRFWAGREERELQWIAAVLRAALAIEHRSERE